MAFRKWTREQILELLTHNDKAVGRALLSLLEDQTFDEQRAEDTRYVNGKGFTSADARIMTSMAKQFRSRGFLTANQLGFLRKRTGTRFPSRIGKYAAQISRKVNGKIKQLEFDLQELESRSQSPEVKRLTEVKRKELERILPKAAAVKAACPTLNLLKILEPGIINYPVSSCSM